jgi:N-acetylneuraminic acid mutarotase
VLLLIPLLTPKTESHFWAKMNVHGTIPQPIYSHCAAPLGKSLFVFGGFFKSKQDNKPKVSSSVYLLISGINHSETKCDLLL